MATPRKARFKVCEGSIRFRIDIDFPQCDVDVVYDEVRARGYSGPVPTILCGGSRHKITPKSITPTEHSVDIALDLVSSRLEDLGISVQETYGLMMGTCHFIVECEIDHLQATKEIAIRIANEVFESKVKYYKS